MPDFAEWLRAGRGIFWVSGKAGSGKSTLIKFLTDHEQTEKLLNEWAPKTCIIGSHFFWNAGTSLQKSQEGLYRTLLYQIWRQCPNLIPKQLYRPTSELARGRGHWTVPELLRGLEKLGEQQDIPEKFFFFIDGLDEYDGDHSNIINVIQKLGRTPNIKICASSRPWTIFRDAFGSSELKFFLQDLTSEDIALYIADNLQKHPKFQRIQTQDEQGSAKLADEVCEKAEGVFLWVTLVVRSLISGLAAHDDIRDLMLRLYELPADLKDYFRHMFDTIESVYRQQTARIRLVLLRTNPLLPGLITFHFLQAVEGNPKYKHADCKFRSLRPGSTPVYPYTVLENVAPELREKIFQNFPNNFNDTGLRPSDSAWEQAQVDGTEMLDTQQRRLTARCRDLITFSTTKADSIHFIGSIEFIHKSVVDFLRSPEMYERLQNWAGPNFDTGEAIAHAYLAQLYSEDIYSSSHIIMARLEFILFSDDENQKRTRVDLIEEIEPIAVALFHMKGHNRRSLRRKGPDQDIFEVYPIQNILDYAAVRGFSSYTISKVQQAGSPQAVLQRLLSRVLLYPVEETHFSGRILNIVLIRWLLEKGADPNFTENSNENSVWQLFLIVPLYRKNLRFSEFELVEYSTVDMCVALIQFDAQLSERELEALSEIFPYESEKGVISAAVEASKTANRPTTDLALGPGFFKAVFGYFS